MIYSICKNPKKLLACATIVAATFAMTNPSQAQSTETQYSQTGGWTIFSETEQGRFIGCYAEKRSAYAQAGYGSLLRIGYTPNGVFIGTDYDQYFGQGQVGIDVDGRYHMVSYQPNGTGWQIAEVNLPLEMALRAGSVVILNLEPQGPEFSLKGSSAAIDETVECLHRQGRVAATTTPQGPTVTPSPPAAPQGNVQAQSGPHEWINADEWSVAGYRFKGPRNRKSANCRVDYRNQTIASGSCTFESRDSQGSFEIFVGGVQAKVYVYGPGEGDGSDALGALKGRGFDRFAATGALYRDGACWGNRTNKICAW